MTKKTVLRPMTCWVISDGRRGIENQALGLAEALGRLTSLTIDRHIAIDRHIVSGSALFKALPPLLQIKIKRHPESYGLKPTPPSLVIGCGRQAIAPLLAIKKTFGSKTFTTYIQDPRIAPEYFNVVIAPKHDGLSGPNVDTIIGSPNRLTPKKLEDALEEFKTELAALPPKRIAVIIGGSSKRYTLTKAIAQTHIAALLELVNSGYSLMVSMSRRTPKDMAQLYKETFADTANVWFYSGLGKNPYFAFLGAADAVIVTEESTNMLTEAGSTGKPVFTLKLVKKQDKKISKFETLHAQLSDRCQIAPYTNAEDLTARLKSSSHYLPLNETERVANQLLQRLKTAKTI